VGAAKTLLQSSSRARATASVVLTPKLACTTFTCAKIKILAARAREIATRMTKPTASLAAATDPVEELTRRRTHARH